MIKIVFNHYVMGFFPQENFANIIMPVVCSCLYIIKTFIQNTAYHYIQVST